MAKKHRTSEILVQVISQNQAEKRLAQTLIADLAIRITPHRSLNSSKGVVSEYDLLNEIFKPTWWRAFMVRGNSSQARNHTKR